MLPMAVNRPPDQPVDPLDSRAVSYPLAAPRARPLGRHDAAPLPAKADPINPPIDTVRAAVAAALEAEANAQPGDPLDAERLARAAALEPADDDGDAWRTRFGHAPLTVVAYDAPDADTFVRTGSRPVDRAGAAALLRAVGDADNPASIPSRLGPKSLFASGASGLVVCASSEADTVVQLIRDAVRATVSSLGAQEADAVEPVAAALPIACATLPVWPDELVGSGPAPDETPSALGLAPAGSAWCGAAATVRARLRRARSAVAACTPSIDADTARCDACAVEAAHAPDEAFGETLCHPCAARRRAGRRAVRKADHARSFRDIAGAASMAVVHASAIDAGRAFAGTESLADDVALASALTTALAEANDRALAHVASHGLDPDRECHVSRLAATDALAVIPARHVFPYAERFIGAFHTAFDRLRPRRTNERLRLGVALGIAIAPPATPIDVAVDAARALATGAKRAARSGDARSAVDFARLDGGAAFGAMPGAIRDAAPWTVAARDGEPTRRLTQRPFTDAAFRATLDAVRALVRHRAPRDELYALAEQLRRDTRIGTSAARGALARCPGLRGALRDAGIALDAFPWEPVDDDVVTRLVDWVEVLRFAKDADPARRPPRRPNAKKRKKNDKRTDGKPSGDGAPKKKRRRRGRRGKRPDASAPTPEASSDA